MLMPQILAARHYIMKAGHLIYRGAVATKAGRGK